MLCIKLAPILSKFYILVVISDHLDSGQCYPVLQNVFDDDRARDIHDSLTGHFNLILLWNFLLAR